VVNVPDVMCCASADDGRRKTDLCVLIYYDGKSFNQSNVHVEEIMFDTVNNKIIRICWLLITRLA
jgi:hypothetical protein